VSLKRFPATAKTSSRIPAVYSRLTVPACIKRVLVQLSNGQGRISIKLLAHEQLANLMMSEPEANVRHAVARPSVGTLLDLDICPDLCGQPIEEALREPGPLVAVLREAAEDLVGVLHEIVAENEVDDRIGAALDEAMNVLFSLPPGCTNRLARHARLETLATSLVRDEILRAPQIQGPRARRAQETREGREAQAHAPWFDDGHAVDALLGLEHVRIHAHITCELDEPVEEHPCLRAHFPRCVLDRQKERACVGHLGFFPPELGALSERADPEPAVNGSAGRPLELFHPTYEIRPRFVHLS
jgi:hypothetical protein